MRKILSLVLCAGIALVAACGERPATSPESPTGDGPRANVALPQCEKLTNTQVQELINQVYTYVQVPIANGTDKWSKISAGSVTSAWDMAKEILEAKQQLGLSSTTAMTRLINYAFCTVGVAVGFPGGDGWVVAPSATTTINLVTADKQAAFVLPPGSIEQISLLAITSTTDTLRTNLDKYPITRNFSKYPSNKFATPAQVYICGSVALTNNNWEAVVNRLRLGHNIGSTGFEILPYATQGISLLSCNENILAEAPPSVLERSLNMVLPKFLWAQKGTTRGCAGVGGNVSELSPIGPVDPQIIPVAASELTQSAQAGTAVASAPAVRLITANGRNLQSIPVTFSVASGGGSILPTTAVPSDSTGVARSIAWTLGLTSGTNTARGTPANGGEAVTGTYFEPKNVTFSATANVVQFGTPAKITLTGGPVANATYVAGTTLPLLTATVRDANNNVVTNYTGAITAVGSLANSLAGTLSINAVNGVARFSNLRVRLVGSQSITIRTTVNKVIYSAVTPTFVVSPSTPTAVVLVGSYSTSAAVGTNPTTRPTVQVRDSIGNPVPNAIVYFGPSNNSSAITPANATTASTGNATVSTWPLQFGVNNLMARLDATVSPTVASRRLEFTATGTLSTASTIANCTTAGTLKSSIRTYSAVWSPTSAQLAKPISNVKFYLSTGNNATTSYQVYVRARVFSSTGGTLIDRNSLTSTAVLSGLSTENKQVNFAFGTALSLAGASRVLFTITDATNPTTSAVNFNLGNGSACGGTTIVNTTTPTTTFRTGSQMVVVVQ